MGRHLDAVRLGQVGDLADLRDAARVHHVRLDDGSPLPIEQFLELVPGEQPFAGGDRHGRPGGDVTQAARGFAQGRLLDP